eukprot:TRINITY_DN50336_c0_g1_i1.p1 TRINITY_DN50336_c0_g1~~TRINITY_DN50336_c0_g1_i1.p1  ORF type:complete len:409 (+),score=120.00 TRINITY_DN50336_c0_g1_i1:95-1228(+)
MPMTAAGRAARRARPFAGPAARRQGRAASSQAPHKVLLFNGDGVGPEIVGAAVRVLEATGVPFEWTRMEMGFEAAQKSGHVITEDHLSAFERCKVLFKGPLTIPPGTSPYIELRGRRFTSGNQVLRKCFELFANVRPAKTFPGAKSRFEQVNVIVVRENTEDVYTGEETWVDDDTVHGVKRITRRASTRIAESAYQIAASQGRKRVTAVHKANVCKQADGLFLSCAREVAKRYPDIRSDDQLADSLLTKMVIDPSEWDVLLCPNLYGDMVSDLAAGLVGSLGLCPSAQYGADCALFEPCHGSAPDIAGKGLANPVSQILSGTMMLRHLGEAAAADLVEQKLGEVLQQGGSAVTRDLGGSGTTESMAAALCDAVARAA